MTIDNNLARMEKERETFSFECQNQARFPAGLRQITFIVGWLVRRLRNLGQFLKRRINEVLSCAALSVSRNGFAHEYTKMSIENIFFGDCSLFGRKFSTKQCVREQKQINFAEHTVEIFPTEIFIRCCKEMNDILTVEFILRASLFRFAKYFICFPCDLLKYLNDHRYCSHCEKAKKLEEM